MFLDHMTVAVPDLAKPLAQLGAAGLFPEYGGVHSNGITHMALVSFKDGSYLEVVAPVNLEGRVALWSDFSLPYHGGTAWTVATQDVAAELDHAKNKEIGGAGPVNIRRTKPNGDIGSWDLAYFAGKQPGGTLPFLIHDLTPREVRVPRNEREQIPQGWSAVALAVDDMQDSILRFQQLYGWGEPDRGDGFVSFPGTPVLLHSPAGHLERYGPSPSAAVFAVSASLMNSLDIMSISHLGTREVHWLNLPWPQIRLGVEIA